MALMFRSVLQNAGGAAELIVTCDSKFAGATISCSDGTTTLNKTCPSSSPYEVTFKIPNSGDWTISATVSGTAYTSDPISVELDYTALLEYGLNWRRWVDTAQYLDSTDYNSLEEVLADEEAVRELCLEHACVDYLAAVPSVNADIETVINNDLFAKWVNNSDYSLDVLGANVAIKALMDTADKYGYGEWTLVGQVPKMTSNSAPYGTVICDSEMSGAYYAFDRDSSQNWNSSKKISEVNSNVYVGYVSTSPIIVKRAKIKLDIEASAVIKIQGSNTGNTDDWHDISEQTSIPNDGAIHYIDCSANSTAYSYHRALYVSETASNPTIYAGRCFILQFYAWAPKGNVPIMTANNAPYGEASAYRTDANSSAHKAFDGDDTTFYGNGAAKNTSDYIRYKFTNPICVKKFMARIGNPNLSVKLRASNDGITFVELGTYTAPSSSDMPPQYYDVDNNDFYLYYELRCNGSDNDWYAIYTLQFYGRELKVSVPIMTSDNAPYGTASASSVYSADYPAWKAFNFSEANGWAASASGLTDAWVQYEFNAPMVLKQFAATMTSDSYLSNMKVQGSNTGNENDFTDLLTFSVSAGATIVEDVDNSASYKYYRVFGTTNTIGYGYHFQFYGLDYSEKEFEEGTTKKWLYDHGVELEEMGVYAQSGIATKNNDALYIKTNSGNYNSEVHANNAINLTDYALLRAKVFNIITQFTLRITNAIPVNYGEASKIVASKSYATPLTESPNNAALDISAINQNDYVTVSCAGGASVEVKELWLE